MSLGPSFTLDIFSPKEESPLDPADKTRIAKYVYVDSDEDLDTLKLTIDNKDQTQSENPAWAKGNEIETSFGVGNNRSALKRFVIKTAKGFPNLVITAFETTIKLNAVDRCRIFENVKLSDIARTLAREQGFSDVNIQDTATTHIQITQAHEPDARFLKRIAEKVGFQFFIDSGVFHWHERDFKQQPLRLLKFFTSKVGDIIKYKFIDDSASKPGEIEERGFDSLEKSPYVVTGSDKDTKRTSLGSVVGVYNTETAELQLITKVVRPTAAKSEPEAKEVVDGKFKKSLETQVGLSITTALEGSIPAKVILRIEGIGSIHSGNFYVKQGTHTITKDTGRSVFKCLRNAVSGNLSKKKDEGAVDGDKNEVETPKDAQKLEASAVIDTETGKPIITYRPTAGKT